MADLATVSAWLHLLVGSAFLLVGAAVPWKKPRTRLSLTLSVFLASWGARAILRATLGLLHVPPWRIPALALTSAALALVGAGSLVLLAYWVPARMARSSRIWDFVAVWIGLLFLGGRVIVEAPWLAATDSWPEATVRIYTLSNFSALPAAYAFAATLFAVRFHRSALENDVRAQRHFFLLTIALVLGSTFSWGVNVGFWDMDEPFSRATVSYVASATAIAVLAIVWASNIGVASPPLRPYAAATLATILAMGALGTVWGAFAYVDGQWTVPDWLQRPLEVLSISVLAYGVLRQQLFDIDIRLKWTMRRGTTAGAFVATFFIVSQLIQNFTTSAFGLAGGAVAAGLLLFALHPLQRMADRLANAAMPRTDGSDPTYLLARKQDMYRNALAAAWADGQMTPKDMRLLLQFRDSLGLAASEYARIEQEWGKASPAAGA